MQMNSQLLKRHFCLLLVTMSSITVTRADAVQRFIYKSTSDTATLSKGKQELGYQLWLEDWNSDGWDITVLRNDLTYRIGLTERTEFGISQMHSSYHYSGWGSRSGFHNLELYGKHQFLSEPDSPVTVSLGGWLILPTGSESKGFAIGETYTGEFVAISKLVGPWRVAGHIGLMNTDHVSWNGYDYKDQYYWGVGAMQREGTHRLNLELFGSGEYYSGSGERLKGLIGISQPISGEDTFLQYGLLIPMDGKGMNLGFILSLVHSF